MENPSQAEIRELLSKARTIAVVGCSRYPSKDAHRIPRYMQQAGYRIIPINPFADEILSEKSYPSLDDIPDELDIDIVDIFRPSEDVPPIVAQAVDRGVDAVWLQLGIRDDEAAAKAREAGLIVIQDRCIKIDHQRLA